MVRQNRRTPRGRQSERAGVRKKGGRGGDRWTSVQYRADRRPVDTLQVIVVCKTSGQGGLTRGGGGGQSLTSGEWGRLLSWGGVVGGSTMDFIILTVSQS